jgi:hypothetical protein
MARHRHPSRRFPAVLRTRSAELAVIGGLGVALALVVTWPLALHMGSRVPSDAGDPLLQAWQVAWDGHALVHQPLHFFQANTFWPLRDSLAFSDALIGYTPAGLIGSGPKAAVVRYDLLFMAAIALAFGAAYLLARELGAGRFGGVVGGLAYAASPWRLSQAGHLHVLSGGGIPLSLFLLLRGYRRRGPLTIVAGWLVAAWQVSLGFSLGLPLLYLLLVLGAALVASWLRRGRPPIPRHAVWPTIVGGAVLILCAASLAAPYVRVLHDHPEAARTLTVVRRYSPPVQSFASAAPDNLVWGGITTSIRATTRYRLENALFPGVTIVLLALAGYGSRAYSIATRRRLAAAVLISAVFALGFSVAGHLSPYRVLWEIGPGWRGVRAPGRIFALTTLALAVLAAAGAERTAAWAGKPMGRRLLTAALPILILVEALGPVPTAPVPRPVGLLNAVGPPVLVLPTTRPLDIIYEYSSTDGFPSLVNGYSGFTPRELKKLRRVVRAFPNVRSVALLRARGVRTVLVERAFARGTPWRHATAKPIRGLDLTRRQMGETTVFSVGRRQRRVR